MLGRVVERVALARHNNRHTAEEQVMTSSKPIPCGPCQEGKVNTKADIWCYNCDEGLCSTCSGHHKRSKGTRDHKTIDIKSYKPISCGPCQEGKVNTKADIWCYNCDEGLCSTCSGHHKRSKGTRDHKTIDIISYKPIPCGPCQEGKVKTKADIWCYNCDEGLCSIYSGHHKRSKGTRDHKTIDIKSYKPSNQAIKTECDKHGQQLNLYCPSHLMPCCDECISTSHSKCTGIKSLASVVEKTNIEKSKESLDKDINSILHLLDKMVNNKSTNIKTGEQQCEGIKESIVKIRNQINKYLLCLEEKLSKETDNLWDKEKSTARDFISEVEGKKKKLEEMKEHLHAVTTHDSKLQSFLRVHQMEQQVHQCQLYVDDLENNDRAKEFQIKMKQNDEIENILKKLGSLECLGEVTVVKTETDFNIETSVRREAQVESREQSNINNMTMNIETGIEINIKKVISDMICLIDGKVILVEKQGKVNILTSDGKLEKQLPIPGGAWSVTQINQNTIAITYPTEKAIKIFNMENETVTKVITLNRGCRDLSFSNNLLAVGLDDDENNDVGEIHIIDLEGNKLKSIQVQSKSQLYNLVYCNDRVIYSDCRGKAVYCYDGSGKQIWQYTQDLTAPVGLCTDTYGNIILADCFF